MHKIQNADLHCHSVVSDGTLTPEQLAQRAAANGVALWSLTDHDEIGGQHRAAAAARAAGIRYLTGTELTDLTSIEPGEWVMAKGGFEATSAACGVTPQAQKTGSSSSRTVTASP